MAIEKDRIRRADATDCAAVLTCVCAAYSKYVARIGREPAPMRADYATLIERRVVHVVSDPTTDALCGIIVLWPKDGAMLIENVAVHPHYQGRRLGRRLMAFAEEQARAGGFQELHLYTNEAMTESCWRQELVTIVPQVPAALMDAVIEMLSPDRVTSLPQ